MNHPASERKFVKESIYADQKVGETVRFLPQHCMMKKVHSGVVLHSVGKKLRIEGIDLKVW